MAYAAGNRPAECRYYSFTRNYAYDYEKAILEGRTPPTEDEWKDAMRAFYAPVAQSAHWTLLMFHDKDLIKDDNGNIIDKGLHLHGIAHYTRSLTFSAAVTRTGVTREENVQPITNKKNLTAALLYLTHSTERARKQKKYEYDVSAVEVYVAPGVNFDYRQARFGNIPESNKLEEERRRDVRLAITMLVKDGVITVEQAQMLYDMDAFKVDFDALMFNQHRTAYEKDRDEFGKRMTQWLTINQRSLTNIYVQGPSGRSKTEVAVALARYFGDGKPFHLCGTKGKDKTFDFANTYDGEKVSVLNELQGNFYEPAEFCSLFDPIHAATANSRNKDKPWYANFCINTTSVEFERFIWSCYQPYAKDNLPVGDKELSTDKEWQDHYESDENIASKICEIRRRWQIWVELTDVEENGATVPCAIIRVQKTHFPAHCFYRDADKANYAKSGIWHDFATVPLRSPSDFDWFCKQVDAALHYYYEVLHPDYYVTPWNAPKPDFHSERPFHKSTADKAFAVFDAVAYSALGIEQPVKVVDVIDVPEE